MTVQVLADAKPGFAAWAGRVFVHPAQQLADAAGGLHEQRVATDQGHQAPFQAERVLAKHLAPGQGPA
jgi:hypothetical protein